MESKFTCKHGFTLIELVVGMMVLGIGLVLMATMLYPQADRAAENLHRMRAAELAQSVMNEIWSKRYDPKTGEGGIPRCTPTGNDECTVSGTSGNSRSDFNNLNDYAGLDQDDTMLGSSKKYADLYPNFKLNVSISSNNPAVSKIITITVTTPLNEAIRFTAIRSNY
ncbi:type II secretion system protein [Parashewanella curva]|uniref:Type II secretion system protein n=1 Tax=Parashewanella curva TaxID=2338552 RepID=A0A3L8PUD9_9GAMM|nr:type II secretion system protein [Parashewanella curva]RLV59037.1 type II secretion system protein [Parashewanella curva]